MLNEVENYLLVLEHLRGQVRDLLVKFSAESLDWRPLEGTGDLATNSPAALVTHLAGSENFLIAHVIGRRPIQRDREGEFRTKEVEVAELLRRLSAGTGMAEEILSPLTLAQLEESRKWLTGSGTVRRCILHAISHYAAHLGHMQLTYQLWLDQVGKVQLASNPDRIAAGRETSTEGRGKKGK